MSREGQKERSAEVRSKILKAAREIIQKDGAEALSIRAITDSISYSSGIVYHYFKNKDEILFTVLMESYTEIWRSIKNLPDSLTPEEKLRASLRTYIEHALTEPLEYKAFMFSSLSSVLSVSSVLDDDAPEKRPVLIYLVRIIEEGMKEEVFVPCNARLTACAVWSAMFGIIIRLIIEGTSQERASELVDNQIEFILKGLKT